MKLHLASPTQENTFSGYGDDYVAVRGQRYSHSVVVTPRELIVDWQGITFDQLTEQRLELLLALNAEIVLLGTGRKLRFPKPALLRPLIEARVGIEVMDNGAACRTYNILLAEGRNVAAVILIG